MLNVGDVRRSYEVGLSGENLVTWVACSGCGKLRWKRLTEKHIECVACAARKRAREVRLVTFFGGSTPQAGDITEARTLGLAGEHLMFYDPCAKCGTPHWVRKNAQGTHCSHCAPKNTGHRRDRNIGSRYFSQGYAFVYIEATDPLRIMARKDGWVSEHRLVVARRIGRPLIRGEVVHHINGIRSDNSDANLQLLIERTHHSHLTIKDMQKRIQALEGRVTLLETENVLLRLQLDDTANPEPSRGDISSGVCRDLTGDTLQKGEEKVHSSRKLGGNSA